HPVFREIMNCWEQYSLLSEISFVVAGTEIPEIILENAPNSNLLRWCSDTGGFDQEFHQGRYVMRYPPEFATSAAGKHLLKWIWLWCRGRHRVTAVIVTCLLRDGFQCPHLIFD
ncbi:hypothetical protein DFH07DRAFT_702269, partial [Mycena maculata]